MVLVMERIEHLLLIMFLCYYYSFLTQVLVMNFLAYDEFMDTLSNDKNLVSCVTRSLINRALRRHALCKSSH